MRSQSASGGLRARSRRRALSNRCAGKHLSSRMRWSSDSEVRSSPSGRGVELREEDDEARAVLLTPAACQLVVTRLAGELEMDALEREQAFREVCARFAGEADSPAPSGSARSPPALAGKQELRVALRAADDIGVQVEELPAAAARAGLAGADLAVGELDPDQLLRDHLVRTVRATLPIFTAAFSAAVLAWPGLSSGSPSSASAGRRGRRPSATSRRRDRPAAWPGRGAERNLK